MSDLVASDVRAYKQSVSTPFNVIIRDLIDLLGLRLVAEIAGVTETRAVREWADGIREARGTTHARLRFALRLVWLLASSSGSAEAARAWLECPSPQLGNRIPARVLRNGDLEEVGPELVNAAFDLSTLISEESTSDAVLAGA